MVILQWLIGALVVGGAFGFIIFIHEMGHFLVARSVGIRCPQFAIGFGPALFSFRWRGTLFGLRLFPFGGYVLMVGEDPNADQGDSWHDKVSAVVGEAVYPTTAKAILAALPAVDPASDSPVEPGDREDVLEHLRSLPPDQVFSCQEALEGNFNHKTIPQRIAVILGGVTMNFIAATLIMWGLGFTVGLGDIQRDAKARLSSVEKNSAAARAGLLPGDLVQEVAGQPILSGPSMVHAISSYPGKSIDMTVLRAGKKIPVTVTPDIRVGGLFFSSKGPNVKLTYMPEGAQPYYQKLGAQLGDVIVAVEQQPVTSPEHLVAAIQASIPATGSSGQESKVKLQLQREGQGPITLEGTPAELKPVGKIGVGLTQVMSLSFHHKTTRKVVGIKPGSLAEQMGFQVNDELHSIDGYTLFDSASLETSLAQLSSAWPSTPHTVNIEVIREPEPVNLVLKVAPPATVESFGLQLEAIDAAMILAAPPKWIGHFIVAPVYIGMGLVKGFLSFKTLQQGSAGPIGMMQMIYEVSDEGLPAFLFFVAILNAAVGAFNVIPFPALDGSRCLILLLSWARGKEFDSNREAQFHFLGLLILLSLVLLMSFQDVSRWLSGTPLMK